MALIAASLAFGNVKALHAKIGEALDRLGPEIALAADDARAVSARLRGFRHRIYRDRDLVGLIVGARRVQRASGLARRRLCGRALAHRRPAPGARAPGCGRSDAPAASTGVRTTAEPRTSSPIPRRAAPPSGSCSCCGG